MFQSYQFSFLALILAYHGQEHFSVSNPQHCQQVKTQQQKGKVSGHKTNNRNYQNNMYVNRFISYIYCIHHTMAATIIPPVPSMTLVLKIDQ